MIKRVFDSLPKGCTAAWLAGELNCGRANVYNIFNRANIDVELLARLSAILGHDFFRDLSDALAADARKEADRSGSENTTHGDA